MHSDESDIITDLLGVDQIDASSINYKVVNQLLEKYVNSSKDYLISSLRMEG